MSCCKIFEHDPESFSGSHSYICHVLFLLKHAPTHALVGDETQPLKVMSKPLLYNVNLHEIFQYSSKNQTNTLVKNCLFRRYRQEGERKE